MERGVRFVQLYINGQIWDNHTALASDLKSACDRTDQPVAALLNDLKQNGGAKHHLATNDDNFVFLADACPLVPIHALQSTSTTVL